MNRSVEVEALAVQWMALLKAGDGAAAISLVSSDEATLLVGSAPSDWYPGGHATIEHVREAISASGAFRSSRAHLRAGPTATSAGLPTR